MSKNELQKILNNTPGKSYKDKVKQIEDYFVSIADGESIIGTGKEIIYPEHLWKYKHSFADGIYIREMLYYIATRSKKNCVRYRRLCYNNCTCKPHKHRGFR